MSLRIKTEYKLWKIAKMKITWGAMLTTQKELAKNLGLIKLKEI